jgi:LPS sulfotransferase NodH
MQAVWHKAGQTVETEGPPRPVLRRAAANPNYTQFIILAQARTGSNFLQFLLDAHKNVFLVHEIFNHREDVRKTIRNVPRILQLDDDPVEYVESCVYTDHKKRIKAAGFKLLYYQARNDEWQEIWDYLRSPHLKVIHLKRRNLLDRYLSFKLAMRSDVWIAFKNNTENGASKDKGPIILEARECFEDFRSSVNQQEELDEFFKDQPKLDVIYEDLHSNIMDESRRIQEFLGLKFQDLPPQTNKQQTKKKSEVIANYEELRAELTQALAAGEQWAREEWLEFFDD